MGRGDTTQGKLQSHWVSVDSTDVLDVFGGPNGFVILKADTTIIEVQPANVDYQFGSAPAGLNNVRSVFSGSRGWIALKTDGSIVGWGEEAYGGVPTPPLSNVKYVASGRVLWPPSTARGRWSAGAILSKGREEDIGISDGVTLYGFSNYQGGGMSTPRHGTCTRTHRGYPRHSLL